jgi:hypothetical protein
MKGNVRTSDGKYSCVNFVKFSRKSVNRSFFGKTMIIYKFHNNNGFETVIKTDSIEGINCTSSLVMLIKPRKCIQILENP